MAGRIIQQFNAMLKMLFPLNFMSIHEVILFGKVNAEPV